MDLEFARPHYRTCQCQRQLFRCLLRGHQRRNPRQRMYVRELAERRIRKGESRIGGHSAHTIVRMRLQYWGVAEMWPLCVTRSRDLVDAIAGLWMTRSGRKWTPKTKEI